MVGNNVRALMQEFLDTPGDPLPEHVQTVKISGTAHAKLRALAHMVGRSKTSLASELLTAALNDAVETLPNDPLDVVTRDRLLGVVAKGGDETTPLPGMRDLFFEIVENYFELDRQEREQEQLAIAAPAAAGRNGVHK
jgi:hypothetical protein